MKQTLSERRKQRDRKSLFGSDSKQQSAVSRKSIKQSRNQIVQNPRKLVLIFGLVVGFFLFAIGLLRSGLFSLPKLSSGWSSEKYYAMVVAVRIDEAQYQLHLVVFPSSSQSKDAKILSIPPKMMMHAVGGYGMYPSSALVGLYMQEKQPIQKLIQTVMISMGVDVYDLLILEEADSALFTTQDKIAQQLKTLALDQLLFRVQSTTPILDRFKIWQKVQSISAIQVEIVDVQSSFTKEEDGVLLLNVVEFDRFAEQKLANLETLQSRETAAVFNTTTTSGLASRYARSLSSMGVSIIRVDSLNEFQISELDGPVSSQLQKKKHILVFGSEEVQNSIQGSILRRMMGELGYEIVDSELAAQFRADSVVLIGSEF